MQVIAPVTSTQLLAAGQEPLMKLEVYYSGAWRNICNLGDKNYLQNISLSFGGARMTPNPIAGTWNATINNVNSIFHPQHPTSAYKDYFRAGREIKITIGAHYAGVDYYWQRIIGYMDEPRFDVGKFSMQIKGLDYTKVLADTTFKKTALPPDNYWGALATFDSKSSEGTLGGELYDEFDAMEIEHEDDNVANWTPTNCAFNSLADGAAPEGTHVGQMVMVAPADFAVVKNPAVTDVNVTAGKKYKVAFEYRRVAGSSISVLVYQNVGGADRVCGAIYGLSEDAYTEVSFYFTALITGPAAIWIAYADLTNGEFRIDAISIKEQTAIEWYRYEMPVACTGVHFVTLDGVAVWPGKQKGEGWYYDSVTKYFYFDEDKDVEAGAANLKIYYFTQQVPENVVADLLVKADLYANRGVALIGMDEVATGITIDQVWFVAGSSLLNAIKMICERCNYRFHFTHNGTPVFKPAPIPVAPITFIFLPHQIAGPNYYQDRNEIRNRVVIEGLKQALPEGAEEAMPSELKGEVNDATSIDDYGEHTLSIRNHLFQDQASIDAMCAILLAKYKDPKWYFDFNTPFNPVPLEVGDTLRCYIRLYPVSKEENRYSTFKYGDGTKYGLEGIIINQPLLIRDIKANQYNLTYKCEKVV